jgi:hypothetical protein
VSNLDEDFPVPGSGVVRFISYGAPPRLSTAIARRVSSQNLIRTGDESSTQGT